MPRPASHQRDDAISALRSMTSQHGAKEGARLAREQFPNVPAGTWGRWRQMAVGNAAGADALAMAGLAQQVKAVVPAPETLAKFIADPVPATHKAVDFWRMLDELEHDTQMMRDFAFTTDPSGKLKLRVPFALRDAHKMRCDLIRLALQQAEVAWSAERSAEFYRVLIEAIGEESPSCQRKIMKRLHATNNQAAARGF